MKIPILRRIVRRRRPESRMEHLLGGYRTTCMVLAAIESGVIDALSGRQLTDEQLAGSLGADREALRRFVRALTRLDLVIRRGSHLSLTPLGNTLTEGQLPRDVATLVAHEYLPAWTALPKSIASGRPAFDHVFGKSAWVHREERPELGARFDRFMDTIQGNSVEAVLSVVDFSRFGVIVDVGGGKGRLLSEVLKRYPSTKGILFDQLHVVHGSADNLSDEALAGRCTVVGGSFFESVPTGGDAYVLRNILHDWDDDRCRAILRSCRDAMHDGSVLLIAETVMPDADEPLELVLRDIQLMAVLGGAQRTRSELDALLRGVGLTPRGGITTAGGGHVLEARLA